MIPIIRRRPVTRATAILLAAATLSAAGCTQQNKASSRNTGTPEVGYIVVKSSSVPLVTELPGRTSPLMSSDVRPQISGVIYRRLFTEGALVKKGQPLYEIDPSLYRAAVNQASANLASAQANAAAAKVKADRYKPLAADQAVAAQDYTDAVAAARAADASVAQTRAALDTARINLRFTTVPAPISGRIGRSLFTEGALVTTGQTDPLAVISALDPIFVDIQQSSADMLRLRRALAAGGAVPTRAEVQLKLEDGSDYGLTGSVEFSEVTVDPGTGTVTLRAKFPNPQGLLLPGMFVRAEFAQASDPTAILVPQVAVTRDPKGNAQVYLVGPGNKAVARSVTATRVFGTNWVVTAGLKPGDKVITEGVGKVKADGPIKPVPAGSPQQIGTTGKSAANGGTSGGKAG